MLRENNPLVLTCTFTSSNPATSTSWYLDTVQIEDDDKYSVSLSEFKDGVTTSTLALSSPEIGDGGEYLCEFDGLKASESYSVHMMSLEASATMPVVTSTEPARLICTMKYAAICSLLWNSAAGHKLENTDEVVTTEKNEDGAFISLLTLTLPYKPGHYDGKYRCSANCKGKKFESRNVDVVHEHIYTDKDPVDTGEVLKRKCAYAGKELPTSAAFFKGDSEEPISSEGLWNVNTETDAATGLYTVQLEKSSFNVGDSGSYRCVFTLGDRTVSAVTAHVTYTAITEMSPCVSIRSRITEVTLTCTYHALSSPDEIKWFFRESARANPEEITEGIVTAEFFNNWKTSYLSIGSTPKDGRYTCKVLVGDESLHKETLIISYDVVLSSNRDDLLTSATSLEIVPKQVIKFYCQVTGINLDITWLSDETVLTEITEGVLQINKKVLKIKYIPSTFGSITCRASLMVCNDDKINVVSNSYQLSVKAILFRDHPSSLVYTDDGDRLTLTCSTDNDKDINIHWVFNEDIVRSGKRKAENGLLVSKLKFKPRRHDYKVKCKAFVDYGSPVYSNVATLSRATIAKSPATVFATDGTNSWVSFTCIVQASRVLEMVLRNSKEVVGETEITTQNENGVEVTTGVTKITDLQGHFDEEFFYRINVDNGYAYTDYAKILQAKFVSELENKWLLEESRSTEFEVRAVASSDILLWEKSEDNGETWSIITNNVITKRHPWSILSFLEVNDVQNLDIKYRAVVDISKQEGSSGSPLYSATVQVRKLRITGIQHSDVSGLNPSDKISFWCTVQMFKAPQKIKIQYKGSRGKITHITSTENEDEYVGTLANIRLGSIQSGDVKCTVKLAYYLPILETKTYLNVAFSCDESLTIDNGIVEYYTDEDNVRHAKVSCMEGYTLLHKLPSDVTCDTS